MRGSLAAAVAGAALSPTPVAAMDPLPGSYWLGRDWWGNRLQDWWRQGRRLMCTAVPTQRRGRTVSALTWEVVGPSITLRVRTGTLTGGAGFSGFLVGTGARGDDWRARVLVGAASGTAGGFLATYEADGTVRFREHTDEVRQLRYAELPSRRRRFAGPRRRGEQVVLELRIRPRTGGSALALLRAFDARTRTLLATAQMQMSDARRWVQGGVGLMSSDAGGSGASFWFSDFVAEGPGVVKRPERRLGPVVGTLFTVSGSGLRLTAQLMPVDPAVVPSVSLQLRRGGAWATVATRPLGPAWAARFHVPDWDSSQECRYRVVAAGYEQAMYYGTIPAEPRDRPLVVASLSCVKATHRPLDNPSRSRPRLPGEMPLGLYTQDNVWFPHDRLVAAIASHGPDVLVAHGDQLYQQSPTAEDRDNLMLDFVAKYLLWVWAFRDLTRSVPTVVLTDDHDLFQPNLWGAGGVYTGRRSGRTGGYLHEPNWVNVVQQTLCGHNPEPFDATPVEQGIGVYYGGFVYAGVNFGVLEDRKFKAGPDTDYEDEETLELLGARQEAFLEAWALQRPDLPKVLLTQTMFASLQTDADGAPVADHDTNGWPAAGRDRALRLISAAGAVVLSGDQHMGLLVRHGFRSGADGGAVFDGPLQFAAPGGCVSFQRWFEPGDLPGQGSTPHTGDWCDAFGNPVRVLAVVQPQFTQAQYRLVRPTGKSNFGDRRLKNEGYGILRVDPASRQFTIECWRWDVDPSRPDAQQYPGFPHTVGFDDV